MASTGWAASAAAKTKKLKKRDIEWLREEVLHGVCFGLAARVDQHDLDIIAKLPQDLPARAARRSKIIGIRCHRDPAEFSDAFGNRLEDRYPLRAYSQAVGRVLHVAAGVDASVDVFQRCPHFEFGKRGERVLADGQCS